VTATLSGGIAVDETRVRAMLHSRGLRCTEPRLRLLRVLASTGDHLQVVEIHERITRSDRSGGRRGIDVSTVYRAVEPLHATGLIHPVALSDRPARWGLSDRPHHHAVCITCSAVSQIDAEPLAPAVQLAATISHHRLEPASSLHILGVCPRCQSTESHAQVDPFPR
jgi:Fur family ferric uptake transcriptional regulator